MLSLKTMLLTLDPCAPPEDALALAIPLCQKMGARLFVHSALAEPMPTLLAVGWTRSDEHAKAQAERMREVVGAALAAVPPSIGSDAVVTRGERIPGALEVARRIGADLVLVTGSRGSGPEDWSSAGDTISETPCPVVLVPQSGPRAKLFAPGGEDAPVLVPIDFSFTSVAALRYAVWLAARLPMAINLVHVESELAWSDLVQLRLERIALHRFVRESDARERLRMLVPPQLLGSVGLHVRSGPAAQRILEVAEQVGARSIILGLRHKNVFERWVVRTASAELLHRSACPVWCVPAREAVVDDRAEIAGDRPASTPLVTDS